MKLLDVVFDTLNAFNNISFIGTLTVCLWWVIPSTCTKSIIHRQNILVNLRILCDSMVQACLYPAKILN
jgi:hypothetical protein